MIRVLIAVGAVLAAPRTAAGFEAGTEARNYSKILERQAHVTSKPAFQRRLAEQNARDQVEYPQLVAADPERDFTQNVCSHRQFECAGDVRVYDWEKDGYGMMRPVLFTARNGATLSGMVWATKAGPPRRPAVVITTGGLAPETLYWGFAAALAKHGYVVLTYDVQGQGRSDTYGEGADRMEGRSGGPQAFASGQPFYDGTEDALDFLLSTARRPYRPPPSCGNANGGVGTDHSAKQDRRVARGFNAAHNPLWQRVDPSRIGLAGHSQGAGAVSYVGQADPRVDALVAWDHLAPPAGIPAECPADPSSRADRQITKPGLGLAGDYHQPPEAYTSDPGPEAKNEDFLAYRKAVVDSMQINIRGGTHYEFSFMAGNAATYPFGTATYRGYDQVGWYTIAWLDRYVKCRTGACRREAQTRILSDRWRADGLEGGVDPTGDANLFSFYLRSRFSLRTASGATLGCDDMRAGCPSMAPDAQPADYDLIEDANSPDSAPPSNRFRIVRVRRDRRRGTATVVVAVPGPGALVLRGRRVKRAGRRAVAADRAKLTLRPRSRAQRRLRHRGRLRVRFAVRFQPTGGASRTRTRTTVLIRRERR